MSLDAIIDEIKQERSRQYNLPGSEWDIKRESSKREQ